MTHSISQAPELQHEYLDTNEALLAAGDSWQGPIAFDSEFIRTRTFYPIPGLYQLATDQYSYLIDPLTIDAWAPLIARLDASTPVVMHSCSEDLELLNHHVSVQPAALFDTQVAYGFITPKYSTSYAALVADYVGLELDKGATRSNWLKRPLSDDQVHYAHQDVAWLLQIRERMLEQLESLGRLEWCEQEMRKATTYRTADPMSYYTGLGSAWRLKPANLGALRALCGWREQQARAEDVPRNKIVWDENLLELAKIDQLDESSLRDTLPAALLRRYSDDLLDAHERGRGDLHELEPVSAPLTSSENKLVKELRLVARARAEALGFAPELLSRKREVETYVRGLRSDRESMHNFADWRAELVGDDFRHLVSAPQSGAAG